MVARAGGGGVSAFALLSFDHKGTFPRHHDSRVWHSKGLRVRRWDSSPSFPPRLLPFGSFHLHRCPPRVGVPPSLPFHPASSSFLLSHASHLHESRHGAAPPPSTAATTPPPPHLFSCRVSQSPPPSVISLFTVSLVFASSVVPFFSPFFLFRFADDVASLPVPYEKPMQRRSSDTRCVA